MDLNLNHPAPNQPKMAQNPHTTKKGKTIFISVFLLLIALGFTGYFQWQKNNLEADKAVLELSIKNIKKELNGTSEKDSNKMVALVEANKKRIKWMPLMQEVLSFETPSISFENFSIQAENPHQVQVDGSGKNMASVKTLVQRMKSNAKISDPFLHTIQQDSETGKTNFQLTFNLQ